MDYAKYDDIRPLLPEEVPGAIEGLIALPELRAIYERLGLSWSWEELSALLRSCRSVEDFKQRVSYHWVKQVMRGCCTSVELTGAEQLRSGGAYTYVSNHRDIVLDSAFLNVLLADAGAKYPQIAIGDNLMIYPWVETLVKLNGSFLVRRGLQGRQVLLAAKLLSEYMHEAVAEGQSIWIAQREGRAKDSSDHTQPALLKMLAMGSRERQPAAALASLNIVPVTCSYEY
ncbi:MAG: 1-acyl-sn-glycerol-3-phosphate acyltransferase, partial [Porphyromonadaceae bacterium]|nr:1-acyl-sn-glycerol-3-phosphate acyltransferase [Porphyromonadaceae bacterium]